MSIKVAVIIRWLMEAAIWFVIGSLGIFLIAPPLGLWPDYLLPSLIVPALAALLGPSWWRWRYLKASRHEP
jgi:hypothetical protein